MLGQGFTPSGGRRPDYGTPTPVQTTPAFVLFLAGGRGVALRWVLAGAAGWGLAAVWVVCWRR
jgi:hypothetical protein